MPAVLEHEAGMKQQKRNHSRKNTCLDVANVDLISSTSYVPQTFQKWPLSTESVLALSITECGSQNPTKKKEAEIEMLCLRMFLAPTATRVSGLWRVGADKGTPLPGAAVP